MFLSKILSAAEHPYLFGKGGRMKNNGVPQVIILNYKRLCPSFCESHYVMLSRYMSFLTFVLFQGLTLATVKHHVALQPLFVIMGVGIVFVCAYIGRSV